MKKTCIKCEAKKAEREFPSGRNTCRICRNKRAREWKAEQRRDPEYVRKTAAYLKAYHAKPENMARRRERDANRVETKLERIKRRAAMKANNEVAAGRMPHASSVDCEGGKGPCSGRHEYHHDSYAKSDWLKVRALCVRHHKQWHSNNIPRFE